MHSVTRKQTPKPRKSAHSSYYDLYRLDGPSLLRHCCSQQDLQKKLAQLKEFDKNGTHVDGKVCNLKGQCSKGRNGTHEGLTSYRFAPDKMPFHSEVSFLLDMLRGGIEMHELAGLSENLTRAEHNRVGLHPGRSPSGHKVACIISGKIRGSDRKTFDDKAKAQMKAVTAGADLFICADQEDRIEEHFRNFTNLVRYRTAEDDGGYKADLKNIDQPMRYHEPGTPPGKKSIQWWRLQQCWRLVQQYEQRFDFRYNFYFKTRTDCDMRGGCYPCRGAYEAATKKHGAKLDKVFFANSDRVFGGSRPGFERAATMMSRIESDYFRKTLTTYYPLDWDLVLRSEWRGQLHWPGIVFPRDVFDPRHCCDYKHIKDNLARLKEFDKNGTHVDGKVCNLKGVCSKGRNGTHEGLNSYWYDPGSMQFASETSFLLDMLRGGFEMHGVYSLGLRPVEFAASGVPK
ncbi:EXOSC5 [Symbiodinium sp. KB8]|nr:EXOSC5 [Symbiodinium sp. KB8]